MEEAQNPSGNACMRGIAADPALNSFGLEGSKWGISAHRDKLL